MSTNQPSELAQSILRGLKEVEAAQAGEPTSIIRHTPTAIDIAAIRRKLKLSQGEFCTLFGFNLRTLQKWEGDRAKPSASAVQFLRMIDTAPNRMLAIAQEALHAA